MNDLETTGLATGIPTINVLEDDIHEPALTVNRKSTGLTLGILDRKSKAAHGIEISS